MPSGIYQHKRGVYHHSEITIEKIRKSNTNNPKLNGFKKGNQINKGRRPWNKDLTKYTSDIIMKQAINLTNKPLSPEHKAKSIKALENYRLENPISCIIGTHPTEKTRLKLVKAHTNVPLSESHCKAISKGHKGINTWRKYQIFPVKDTSIEVKVQNFLKDLKIGFFCHYHCKEITHAYQCDIFIPVQRNKERFIRQPIIIECDGDYWHGNTNIPKFKILNEYQIEQVEEDKIRTSELLAKGFKVLRLWESDINTMNLNKFNELIWNTPSKN